MTPQKSKLITCIVPHGRAQPVLKSLKDEYEIVTANIHRARGSGRMTPLAWRGVGETTEKDVLTVIVPKSLSKEIFAYIYDQAGIGKPHGGIIYQQPVTITTDFVLPDLPPEPK